MKLNEPTFNKNLTEIYQNIYAVVYSRSEILANWTLLKLLKIRLAVMGGKNPTSL